MKLSICVYKACDRYYFNTYTNKDAIDEFYVAVHAHFLNPNFKDPFADPYEDFKYVSTTNVRDYLHQRYFYDDEDDELFILADDDYDDDDNENEREISLGHCKEMLQRDLHDLINEYKQTIIVYDKCEAEVSKGIEEMDEVDFEDGLLRTQKAYRKDDIYHGFKDDIADQN